MSDQTHVIVLPGGAYDYHADHEAEPVAAWLEAAGLSASVLRYPIRAPHPAPLHTVAQAICRARDDGSSRVGLLGFSAGGHAAAVAAYTPDASSPERPDFVGLAYPVISMIEHAHALSRTNLLGASTPGTATEAHQLVRDDSPPTFLWHTADDTVVDVRHTYLLAERLAAHGVPHEAHVFPFGDHGLGLARNHPVVGQWRELFLRWLAPDETRLPSTPAATVAS